MSTLNCENEEGGAARSTDRFLWKAWCHGMGAIPLGVKGIHKIVPKSQIIQVVNFMQT